MAEVECVIITVMVTQPLAFTNRDIYTTSTLHIQHLDTTKSRKSGVEKEHFVLLFCMIWNVITSNVQDQVLQINFKPMPMLLLVYMLV